MSNEHKDCDKEYLKSNLSLRPLVFVFVFLPMCNMTKHTRVSTLPLLSRFSKIMSSLGERLTCTGEQAGESIIFGLFSILYLCLQNLCLYFCLQN